MVAKETIQKLTALSKDHPSSQEYVAAPTLITVVITNDEMISVFNVIDKPGFGNPRTQSMVNKMVTRLEKIIVRMQVRNPWAYWAPGGNLYVKW